MNNFYQQQEQILWNQISNNKIFKAFIKAKDTVKTFISNKAKQLKQYFANQQDYIGLDKVNVSNLIVTIIDTNLLLHHPKAKVYTEDKSLAKAITTKPTTNSFIFTYSTILIEDNIKFKSLTLGATITQSGPTDYSQLICFVDRNDEQANYKPYTVAEFKKYITSLQSYIQETYGITIDFSEATFKEMEMNQNVLLQRDFHSYQHTITYLTQNASKKYSRTIFKDKHNRFTGVDLKNNSFELKIYDKKEQLRKKKVHIEQETARFEITVLNKSKAATKNFKKYLGTDKVFEITQDKINSFFSQLLDSIMLNQLFKEKVKQDKYISRISKKYTSTKDLIAKLYKEETQEKLISLFSINQLHNTPHYTQALTLLSQAQLTAQDDLDYITSILKVA